MQVTSFENFGTPIGAVDQIGILVPDLDGALEVYGRMFGITEWTSYRYTPEFLHWSELHGEPGRFAMDLAMSGSGPSGRQAYPPMPPQSAEADTAPPNQSLVNHRKGPST